MAQICYTPDGSPTTNTDSKPDYTPCDASAEFSACCRPTDICISNGYCFQQGTADNDFNNRLARGLCTDQEWTSPFCPQFCKDLEPSSTISVVLAIDNPIGLFCCSIEGEGILNSTTGQCIQSTQSSPNRPFGTEPFTLDEGQVIYDRSNGATLTNSTRLSATTSVNATSTATCIGQNGNGQNGNEINVKKIAIGITVPLGVLLLAALTAVYFLLNKLKRLEKGLREEPAGENSQLPHSYGRLTHPATVTQKHELGSDQVYEADGVPRNETLGSDAAESRRH